MNTSVSNADRQAFEKAQRVLEQDRKMYEGLNQTRFTFLAQAIEMLSFTLETSDTYDDDAPIRLCSLWFANFDYIGENFPQKVGEALGRVSSRKFVFLAHQLTSRMSKNEAGSPLASRDHLRVLVLRMCREHPFHTLYPVYCLQSDHVSSQNPQALSRRHSKRLDSQSSSQIDRAEAALDIFNKLRNDKQCGKKVQDIQILCAASLQWARLPIKSWVTRSNIPYAIPQNMNILNIKSFPVPVITARTAIDPTCKYENCVWIESFETSFTTLGGQNLPKVHFCVGSDGQRYKQLVSIHKAAWDSI